MTTILLKKQVYSLRKLNSKGLYQILILGNYKILTSQGYFEAFFEFSTIDLKDIYLLPCKTTINTKHSSFQHKIVNTALYLNKLLFKLEKAKSPFSFLCKSAEETIIHLFSEQLCAQYTWDQTQIFFSGNITLPNVTTQSVIFGFTDTKHFLLTNYLLLIYECYSYKAKDSQNLRFLAVKNNIIKKKLKKKEPVKK